MIQFTISQKKKASSEPLELESPRMLVANASFWAQHAPGKRDAECLRFHEPLGVMMPRGARASARGLLVGGLTLMLTVTGGRQAVCLGSSWQAGAPASQTHTDNCVKPQSSVRSWKVQISCALGLVRREPV